MKFKFLLTFFLVSFFALNAQNVDVTFQVDMQLPASQSVFNPETDNVFIAGSFNGWDPGLTQMTDNDQDLVYEVIVPDMAMGNTLYFKFTFIKPGGEVTWEEDPNREYTPGEGSNFFFDYWNREDPGGNYADGSYIFKVDMSVMEEAGLFDNNNDMLHTYGSFNGWGANPPAFEMTENNGVWELEMPVTGKEIGTDSYYKFYSIPSNTPLWSDGWERPLGIGGGNRAVTFEGIYGQEVPMGYYDDVLPNYFVETGQTVEITFSVDMSYAQAFLNFMPGTDQVWWICEQPAFCASQGWEDTDEMMVLELTDNNSDMVYEGTLSVNGPSWNGFEYRYAFTHENQWTHEPSGYGDFAYRVRYIEQAGYRTFVQPYAAPQDSWLDQEDKSSQSELTPPGFITGGGGASITFQVNMSVAAANQIFNPEIDTVAISAEFNGWSVGNADILEDTDSDLIYEVTIDGFTLGQPELFKFIFGSPSTGNITWEDDPNREFTPEENPAVYYDYWNRQSPSGSQVKFMVDMQVPAGLQQFNPETDTVAIAGDFNGWYVPDADIMEDTDNDLIYEVTITDLPAGDTRYFKFIYGSPSTGNVTWEDDPNREFAPEPGYNEYFDYWNRVEPGGTYADGSIEFTVDMSVMEETGLFTPPADMMQIRGQFNGWGSTVMTRDPNNSSLWTSTIELEDQLVGGEQFYKFYAELDNPGLWTDGWERPLSNGGDNRNIIFEGIQNQVAPTLFYDDVLPNYVITNGQSVEITFSVDMSPALEFGFEPQFNVWWICEQPAFAVTQGWEDTDEMTVLQMTDDNSDMVYEGTLSVNGPSWNGFEYRYAFENNGQWHHETFTVAPFSLRVRYIEQAGYRVFVQPYAAPQDSWIEGIDKSAESELTPPGFITGGGEAWSAALQITDNGGVRSGDELLFGQHPLATDGIDSDLGETELPPVPPAGAFDIRFILPVTPAAASLIDYRNDQETEINWELKFQPGSSGYPITFNWNPADLPDGSFKLVDPFGGAIVNIDMKSTGEFVLTNAAVTTLMIEFTQQASSTFNVEEGWNIVSAPLIADDMTVSSVFPNASSNAFGFITGQGYNQVSELSNGEGYWLKFPAAEQINIAGSSYPGNVPVFAGWNLVGPFDYSVAVNDITSDPAGIIAGNFFGYNAGYITASTLEPGQGYWIKVSGDGELILNAPVKKAVVYSGGINEEWGKLVLSDAAGNRSVLYTSLSEIDENFELPPAPPIEAFDVRFADNTSAAKITGQDTELKLQGAEYPLKIQASGMDLRIVDGINGDLINITLKDGESFVINNPAVTTLRIMSDQLHLDYMVSQNYPNPFNPSTTIKFAIPERSQVTLKVYDILGSEVAVLANEIFDAGYHTVEFNVSSLGDLSSGVYIYKLQAGAFSQTMKMMLLK